MFNLAQISLAASLVFTAACIHLVARVWSPHRLFFVSLGREMTEADRARSRRVLIINIACCAVGVAAALAFRQGWVFLTVALALPMVPIVALVVEMIGLLRSLPATKVPGRYAVPLEEQPSLLSYILAPLEVAHGAVIVATATVFLWISQRLPDEIPMHWNARGEVDRMGRPGELWALIGIILFDWALVWMVAWAVTKERWALPPERADEYIALQRRRRSLMVRFIEWLMFLINLPTALIWLSLAAGNLPGLGWLTTWGVWSAVILMLVAILMVLVIYIRPMMAVQEEIRAMAGTDVLGTRAEGWRMNGLIYYAPHDPALFVPKKVGIGQTLNFGRPGAWIFLASIIVLPVVLTVVIIVVAG